MAQKAFALKLLVNKATKKVLFAEAPKEVDFLFGLLEMPLGAIIKVLTSERMVGSFGNLFQSVAALDATYLQSTRVRANLLEPVVRSSASYERLLQPPATPPTPSGSDDPPRYYRCSNNTYNSSNYYYDNRCTFEHVSHVRGVTCPSCSCQMTRELILVGSSATVPKKQSADQTKGYVKEVVTYTIMDDLTVTPMSTISGITLLNRYNVRDVGDLEERVVTLGFDQVLESIPVFDFCRITSYLYATLHSIGYLMPKCFVVPLFHHLLHDQGLKLLQVSLQSKTVLSDVFLAPDFESTK